jgi:hypothetical protein
VDECRLNALQFLEAGHEVIADSSRRNPRRWRRSGRALLCSPRPAVAQTLDLPQQCGEGCWTTILVGGGNRALAAHVGATLASALPAYDVVADLGRIPVGLRGLHPHNPVNRCRGGGVQVELPPRARGLGPRGDAATVDTLVHALAAVVTTWA